MAQLDVSILKSHIWEQSHIAGAPVIWRIKRTWCVDGSFSWMFGTWVKMVGRADSELFFLRAIFSCPAWASSHHSLRIVWFLTGLLTSLRAIALRSLKAFMTLPRGCSLSLLPYFVGFTGPAWVCCGRTPHWVNSRRCGSLGAVFRVGLSLYLCFL